MAQKFFYRLVDREGNDVGSGEWPIIEIDEAKRQAQKQRCRLVEDTYEWDETTDVEGYDFTEDEDDEYSDTEVMRADCHGTGTMDMLRCRECDESLGQMHKAGCELLASCGNCGEPADATGRNDDGYCAECRALANASMMLRREV